MTERVPYTRVERPASFFTREVRREGTNRAQISRRARLHVIRAKAKKAEDVILFSIAWNKPYRGKKFNYSIDLEAQVGTWSVYNVPVAFVNTDLKVVSEITLPTSEQVQDPTKPGLVNLTRLLWRHLGLRAKRYKDVTVVENNGVIHVLSEGETLAMPHIHISEEEAPEQLELFTEEHFKAHYDYEERKANEQHQKEAQAYAEEFSRVNRDMWRTTSTHSNPIRWASTIGGPSLNNYRFGIDAGGGTATSIGDYWGAGSIT